MQKNKKAALELSIGTVVIIVIAMSMLILGLVLVKNIFSGATESVDQINEGVKSEIIKLFSNEKARGVVRLTDNTAKIKQGEEFGIAFGVKNVAEGTTASKTYNYVTSLANKGNCPNDNIPSGWIFFGSGQVSVPPGQVEGKIIKFKIPQDAPLCTAEYKLLVTETGQSDPYVNLQFFVQIGAGGTF